jgi:hypothetical protein
VLSPPNHLVVRLDAEAAEQALADWRWLIADARLLYVTAGGDVILADANDHVALLDAGGGAVEPIAKSVATFESALTDPESLNDWQDLRTAE